jgi:two-component system, OmpR family, phosphate regulon sensor histidine kinase PhoR
MISASRRLWLYGALLVLPALALGSGGLWLLARERVRVGERAQLAAEARRVGVETRGRLIAENLESLVADVQIELMDALANRPPAELRAWAQDNALVRVFFSAEAGRASFQPDSLVAEATRVWLRGGMSAVGAAATATAGLAPEKTLSPDARQRFGDTDKASASLNQQAIFNADQARNVRVNLRREAQGGAEEAGSLGAQDTAPRGKLQVASTSKDVTAPAPVMAPKPVAMAVAVLDHAKADEPRLDQLAEFQLELPAEIDARRDDYATSLEARASLDFDAALAPREGWAPWREGELWHVFGWRRRGSGTADIVGVELDLVALASRLAAALPGQVEGDEAYALRPQGGAPLALTGSRDATEEVVVLPLGIATLPGWEVVGLARRDAIIAGTWSPWYAQPLAGVFVLAVVAIGAAGWALLRAAQASEREATQKTSFVANVSHELKTPLTTIRLYAELLAQGRVRTPEQQQGYYRTIGQETERLSRLVNNVLDFSRLEQGKKAYALAAYDLAGELRRLAEAHAPRLAEAGLTLRLELPASQPARTDRDAVEQIVLNLFDNACKYAAEGELLELRLAPEAAPEGGRVLAVRVADAGPGVPPSQRARIFEKFNRLDDRLTADKPGAGLGLSIARQLARGLGGELRCEGRADGKQGAVFVLTLPLA